MIHALVLLVLLGLATPALAQSSGSRYDWQTGSQYRWHTNPDGSTDVRGFNSNTGSQWRTTIEPNGSAGSTAMVTPGATTKAAGSTRTQTAGPASGRAPRGSASRRPHERPPR